MDDRRLLSRHKPHPTRRGIKKPRARNSTPGREAASEFIVFDEPARREFENSPSPMRIFDRETMKFLAVNDAALKFYGYTREEFLALTLKDTRHPDEYAVQQATLREAASYLRHGPARRHIKKSGEIVVVEVVTQDILFNGRKARLSLTIDVSERNKAEDEIRRQKRLLEAVIDNIPARVFIRDAKTSRYVMRNRFSDEDSGHPIGSALGKSVYDLYPRELADLLSSTDAEALKTGRLVEIPELEMTGKSGEPRIRHVRKMPVFDENGQPWMLVGISTDVTERKRVENSLRESNEFLRSVIESSRDCIKVLDLEGRLLLMSAGGQHLMEIDDATPLLNGSYLDFWSGADRELARNALVAARAGGASNFEGYCPTTKGTPKWWDEIVTPILNATGQPEKLLVVSRDITAHKQAEQERLTHAVQQRDALVREVHHRIKNSLQGVAGLLRQKISKYPAIAPEIEEAIAQLQSVALVYGLQETRPDGLLNLTEIMNAICSSAEGLLGGRVERSFERKTQRPACIAGTEAVSVAVALNELVFNALKHQSSKAGEKHARIVLRETADEAEIRITNRGRLPAGFDYPGGRATGSGLELVRTLLASPGGTITFNGAEGEVEVVLKLSPPLLAGRQKAVAG